MSSEQVEIVKNLVEAFRKKNISMSRKTDAENYQIIGRIAVELSNSK